MGIEDFGGYSSYVEPEHVKQARLNKELKDKIESLDIIEKEPDMPLDQVFKYYGIDPVNDKDHPLVKIAKGESDKHPADCIIKLETGIVESHINSHASPINSKKTLRAMFSTIKSKLGFK